MTSTQAPLRFKLRPFAEPISLHAPALTSWNSRDLAAVASRKPEWLRHGSQQAVAYQRIAKPQPGRLPEVNINGRPAAKASGTASGGIDLQMVRHAEDGSLTQVTPCLCCELNSSCAFQDEVARHAPRTMRLNGGGFDLEPKLGCHNAFRLYSYKCETIGCPLMRFSHAGPQIDLSFSV